jgi:hypothetical protein
MTLRAGGVRLTKGRAGKLAQVLRVEFRAVGEPVPSDMFDILRRPLRKPIVAAIYAMA